MATNTSVCAICDLRHVTSRSMHWCPECEEALCSDCNEHHSLSKGTRSHKTIPISQFQSLPTFVTDIQQFCLYHNEKYQLFCTKHECPICYKCIKEHGKCSEVIPLEDVIGEIKSTEIFRDLEQNLRDVLENIGQFRRDREDNTQSIQNQKKTITMEIDNIKAQITRHLETLKESVIKELDQIYDVHNRRIGSIISTLKDQEHDIKHCKTEFESITKYASELQTFLGIREIQSKVADNESRLRSMITNKSLENVDLQFTIDEKVLDVLTSIKAFGSITIKKHPFAYTNMSSKKNKQAQISTPNIMQSINTISVELNRKFNTTSRKTSGISMTKKGSLICIDSFCSNEKLVAINGEGIIEYTLHMWTPRRICGAFDIELIKDNTVAVTTGDSVAIGQRKGVIVVDITSRKVIKFINLSGYSYGITYNGTSLICCVQDQDIHVISCTDDSITTIPNTVSARYSYVTTHADTILYTNPDKHKIVCCSYDGTPVWEFNNDILRTPRGITVDDKGNIFVVGQVSCNVLILSPDGKQYKQILNKENGLNDPQAIFFDKLRNQLLVANNSSDAFLYNISYL